MEFTVQESRRWNANSIGLLLLELEDPSSPSGLTFLLFVVVVVVELLLLVADFVVLESPPAVVQDVTFSQSNTMLFVMWRVIHLVLWMDSV